MIQRILSSSILKDFNQGKAIAVLGPRQVGKTTLIKECLKGIDYLFLDGDDPDIRNVLKDAGHTRLSAIIGNHRYLFIDEAQRIANVGIVAKMIIDRFESVQLILSGSSALELNQTLQESLSGRVFDYRLYPVSWQEFERSVGYITAQAQLEERLIFGMYPDVISRRHDSGRILKQLATSYLYKDVLAYSGIKKPEILEKLLRAIALQLGSEVSYNELSRTLEIDKNTIAKYIDLLEKTFVIFRLNSYSRNQRNEIKNNRKIYFWDNGIRNMIINNLNELEFRNDKGALWENFLISERIKHLSYNGIFANHYFWRTVQKQEIDLIEESAGKLFAYEFKWKKQPKHKIPAAFLNEYPSEGKIVDSENFRDFITNSEQ
jgi:predicted AAA+ superfamily ATPase